VQEAVQLPYRPGGMAQAAAVSPVGQTTGSLGARPPISFSNSHAAALAHQANTIVKPIQDQSNAQSNAQSLEQEQPKHVVVQIRTVFMDEQMQAKAVELAKYACTHKEMAGSPRSIAGCLKKAFDELYGPAWHCVVGRSFGSFVTHGIKIKLYELLH